MITDEQIDFIAREIDNAKIENSMLRDDLLDHMCCLVEMDIKKGLSFDQAYKKAFLQTSPNGYEEIQNETLFLLNKNKIIIMKRITYISGFIFSVALTFGALFKVLHLPGAGVLLYVGLLGIGFIFLPMIFINALKGSIAPVLSERAKWITGMISVMLISAGALFKIMHFPGAAIMLGVGSIIFSLGFLPFLFFRMYRQSINLP